MGLSSKQVSSDGLGWSQALLQAQTSELPKPPSLKRPQPQNHQQQQQAEALKCPRCESTNTKFCYYNNYNKSQPRHFCKTCKRHWTKGGTLRNVPVGGGRKNKRHKTSSNSTNTTATTTTTSGNNNNMLNTHMAIQRQQPKQNLPFSLGDQKKLSDILHMIHPPSSLLQQNPINSSNLDIKNMSANNGTFVGSSLSLPHRNRSLHLPYASSSSFDTAQSSISTSFQFSNVYNYTGEAMEDSNIVTTSMANAWQIPNTSSGGVMDMPSCWNWDDIDRFVSTDLNIPWDDHDPDIKPGKPFN